MKPFYNDNGVTIKELKDLINSLPEKNEYGDDYEVWIMANNSPHGTSNPLRSVMQLNGGDLIFDIC